MAVDLSKYIDKIKVETAFTPAIEINDPFKPGPPNPFLGFLKPKITINVKNFGEQIITPYGDPGPSYWPIVRNALLIFAAGVLIRKLTK